MSSCQSFKKNIRHLNRGLGLLPRLLFECLGACTWLSCRLAEERRELPQVPRDTPNENATQEEGKHRETSRPNQEDGYLYP